MIWWLTAWALLATELAVVAYVESYNNNYNDVYNSAKRSLVKRIDNGTISAAVILVYVTLALALINW